MSARAAGRALRRIIMSVACQKPSSSKIGARYPMATPSENRWIRVPSNHAPADSGDLPAR